MIKSLDKAIAAATGEEINLSRADVMRLLDHLYEYCVIHNDESAKACERYGDLIDYDPF